MIGRAVVLKRGNRSEAEKPFWISYADLMTALMVLFLVAMSVAMMTVTYNAEDVERQKRELEERNVQLNKALTQIETANRQLEADKLRLKDEEESLRKSEEELKHANEQLEKLKKTQKELDDEAAAKVRDQEIRQLLNAVELAATRHPGLKVDKDQHTIDFGDRARFEMGSNSLTPEQARLLRAFVPEVLAIAKDRLGQKWLKQVVVEGFASPEGDYLYNLNLSLERSERVLCVLLAPPSPDEVPLMPDQLAIPGLLDLLERHPAAKTFGLSKLLSRYRQCASPVLELDDHVLADAHDEGIVLCRAVGQRELKALHLPAERDPVRIGG